MTTQTATQPEATETAQTTQTVKVKVVKPAGIRDVDGRVAWRLRHDVDDVKARWGKKPVVHDVNGNCRGSYDEETRDRYWLVGAFNAEAQAEAAGEPRTVWFCTRCVIQYLPPLVEVTVTESEQAEVVEAPAKPETTISLDLIALDEAAASEETPEPEAVKPKARTPRTRKATPRAPRASKTSKTS